jgi:hypothetical protein
MFSLLP